jgi:hypothetical protein
MKDTINETKDTFDETNDTSDETNNFIDDYTESSKYIIVEGIK